MENTTQPAPVVKPALDSIGTLISGAWRLMKANANPLFTLSLGQTAISIALIFLFGTDQESIGYAISSFIASLLALLATVGMIVVLQHDSTKGSLGLGSAISKSINLIPSLLVIIILSTLFISGGLVAFLFPAVIFAIWSGFAIYLLIGEGIKGFAALAKSSIYAQGYVGNIFIRSALMGVVTFFISLAVTLATTGLEKTQNPIVGMVVAGVLAPFTLCYSLLIYRNLVALKTTAVVVPGRRLKLIKIFTAIGLLLVIAIPVIIMNLPAETATVGAPLQ